MFIRCKAIILTLVLFCSPSLATQVAQQIPLDGKPFSLQIPVGTKRVVLWGESRGTTTVPVHLSISVPKGSLVEASAAKTRHANSAAIPEKTWYALPSLERIAQPLMRAGTSYPERQCLALPESELQTLIEFLTQNLGGSWDRRSACRRFAEMAQEGVEGEPLPEVSTPEEVPQRPGYVDIASRYLVRKALVSDREDTLYDSPSISRG